MAGGGRAKERSVAERWGGDGRESVEDLGVGGRTGLGIIAGDDEVWVFEMVSIAVSIKIL